MRINDELDQAREIAVWQIPKIFRNLLRLPLYNQKIMGFCIAPDGSITELEVMPLGVRDKQLVDDAYGTWLADTWMTQPHRMLKVWTPAGFVIFIIWANDMQQLDARLEKLLPGETHNDV